MKNELTEDDKILLEKKEAIKKELEQKRQERKEEEHLSFEKERLMKKINQERLDRQEETSKKEDIKEDLNQRRLLKQRREEIEKNRFLNAKIFKIRTNDYYKLHDNYHDYYIKVDDAKSLSSVNKKVDLMERYYGNHKKIECSVKLEKRNETILISLDTVKVQFKAFKVIKESN